MPTDEEGQEDHRLVAKPTSETTSFFTFEDALDGMGIGLYQNLLLLYVGFAWVCDAMEMMLLSFVSNAADCVWGLSSTQESFITSVVFIGMFLGSYTWGIVADNEGRKRGFFATAMVTAIWGFASAFSPNYAALLVFRGLVGFGLGGICVAFSLFLEFVPTQYRGRYAIAIQGFWTIGALAQAGLAWLVLPKLGWRYLLGISTIPLVIMLLFYPLLQESPRYLLVKGETEKAERILQTMARLNKSELPPGRLQSPDQTPRSHEGKLGMRDHVRNVMKGMFSEFHTLFSSSLRWITSLLFIIWFSNALIYYGVVLLTTELHTDDDKQECGEDEKLNLSNDDYLEIFIDTAAEVPAFFFAIFAIDYLGRKKTIIILQIICAINFCVLPLSDSDLYKTVFLFFARGSIAGSFLTIYVYTPELFPTPVRAFGLGLCVAWSRIGGLIAPLFSVKLVDSGHTVIVEIVFAVVSFAAAIAAALIPVETAGKTLTDTTTTITTTNNKGGVLQMAEINERQASDEEISPL
eukprot:g8793.t1